MIIHNKNIIFAAFQFPHLQFQDPAIYHTQEKGISKGFKQRTWNLLAPSQKDPEEKAAGPFEPSNYSELLKGPGSIP